MGYKYHGPKIEQLPESIRDRIREAGRVAEEETGALGVVLTDEAKIRGLSAEKVWDRSKFSGFRQVYVYESGNLQEAYFYEPEQVLNLRFCGMGGREDRKKIENALGLQVVLRPEHNQDAAQVMVEGQQLEKIASISSSSGLYLGRR